MATTIDICQDMIQDRLAEILFLSTSSSQFNSAPSVAEISGCIYDWFFETKTVFYEYENFYLPWYFGVLCLSFSMAGVFVMFILKPKWIEKSWFPFFKFGFLLTFFQGPLSFMADYMNMNKDSIFHVVDRCFAVPLTFMAFLRILVTLPHQRNVTAIVSICGFFTAIYSHQKSGTAQSNADLEGFIFWHCMWHMYPIVEIVITCFDLFVLGEYDALEDRKKAFTNDNRSFSFIMRSLL